MFVTNSFLFHKTLRLAAGGGAYAITGRAVDIRRLNALSAVRRTYAVAGQSAALRRAARIGLVTGTYAVGGQAVQLRRQLKLSANPASFAIVGKSAGLQKSRVSGFVKTDFAIAGQAVTLKRQLKLAAGAASMAVSFQSVGLLKVAGRVDVIGAEAALIGLDVKMVMARKLASSLATLAVATQQVNLRRNYPIVVQSGVFVVDGVSVGLRAAKRIAAVKAGYAIAGQNVALTPKDGSFASVALLLHLNGSNGATTFNDNGPLGLTVTRSGNAAISTAQSVFGGASAVFDGSGDWLIAAANAALGFGTGNFTVEFSVRFAAAPANNMTIYDGGTNNSLAIYHDTGTSWQIARSGVASDLTFTWNPSTNTWYHFAVTRASGVIRVFVDGVLIATSGTVSSNYGQNGARIGGFSTGYLNGFIDELRVTKGVARYTAAFTKPDHGFADQ